LKVCKVDDIAYICDVTPQ